MEEGDHNELGRNDVVVDRISSSNGTVEWCEPLHFRPDPENHPVVALASYPGSGNTWTRYLLMQATGIHTGSTRTDKALTEIGGFLGEIVVDSSVCVVKTHKFDEEERAKYGRAVLLVRSLPETVLAYWNFAQSRWDHVGYAPLESFYEENGNIVLWRDFALEAIEKWTIFNQSWMNDFRAPLHILRYEQLVTDLEPTLRQVLNFLEIPVSHERMKCVLDRREGLFHRKHIPLPFDPFTDEMKALIKDAEKKVYDRIDEIMLGNNVNSENGSDTGAGAKARP